MLDEYLSLRIDSDGLLHSLPLLLDNHTPQIECLPDFLMRLYRNVNWAVESLCFDGLARECGLLYSNLPMTHVEHDDEDELEEASHLLRNTLFPSFRTTRFCPPPACAEDNTVLHLTSLVCRSPFATCYLFPFQIHNMNLMSYSTGNLVSHL
jgi:DNA mismatch repair protein MLH1